MRHWIVHIALCLLGLGMAQAQGSVRAALDSMHGVVATPFTLELEATIPGAREARIVSPEKEDSSLFILLKWQTLKSNQNGANLNWKAKVWMVGLKDGLQEIPPLRVIYSEGERSGKLSSNPLQITLKPAEIDTTADILPIIEPQDAPYTFREFLPYGIIMLLLGALAFGIWWFLRKRAKAALAVVAPPPPPEPPYTIAKRSLKKLGEAKLWEMGAYKKHYSQATETIREYLEGRLQIPALESTTDETIQALRKGALPKQAIDHLEEILQDADLVKFAKQPADQASCIKLLEQANTWLDEVHQYLDPPKSEEP